VDRRGRELGTLGEIADYSDLALSPDGRRVAVSIRDPSRGQNLDVWILDVDRGVATRVSTERAEEFNAVWTPDGGSLLYISDRTGLYDIYRRPAGGGPEEVVLKTPNDKWLGGLTPDGRRALFHQTDESTSDRDDLWTIEISGSAKPRPLTRSTQFREQAPRASPDGRWLAFVSNETGSSEIYVQPLAGGTKRRVSSGGGSDPIWRRDGRELFYQATDGRLMTVAIRGSGAGPDFAPPESLFDLATAYRSGPVGSPFDVAPDGQRFLVIRPAPGAEADALAVVLNWTASLEKAK
jgi:Tol biopolymer transport system component